MASTKAAEAVTAQYRADQLATRAGSVRNLIALYKAVDPADLRGTIDVFAQAAALLTDQQFGRAGTQAADYFSLFRRAEGVRGRAPVVALAAKPPAEYVAGQLRGAALAGIVNGRRSGMSITRARDNGLVKVIGTFIKLVLTGGNNTIIGAVQHDRQALGWVRVTSDDPCAFCRLLASRGPAYKREGSANFEPHDHCSCTAEPVYDSTSLDQSEEHLSEYRDAQAWARSTGNLSKGTSNNQLNNFRRWLAAGKPTPGNGGTENSGA